MGKENRVAGWAVAATNQPPARPPARLLASLLAVALGSFQGPGKGDK